MSGHSKWANIKHKKGKADAARGKIFTKIGREIAIAVREGGSDPETNGKLRDVVAKAKANNMPNDNILRSIKKAAGELGSVNYEEITYEGYSAGRHGRAGGVRNGQPQPHRLGHPPLFRQVRRQPRRDGFGRLDVRPQGPDCRGPQARHG